jgi:microcystin degradation protein MlrC
MKRVLLAGLHHETHTFVDGVTGLADFEVRRGEELLAAAGDPSPLGGVVEHARRAGWALLPTVDMRAMPSATVATDVVERFWSELRAAAEPELRRGVDGIYLVLHGAMVSEGLRDVEGEILQRLRGLEGAAGVPIAGVLDLHANVSPRMAALSQALVAYRENPHTDAREAAVTGARLLDRLMGGGERATTVLAQAPVMWPPPGTGTASEPMRELEAMARRIEAADPEILAVNVLGGFSFADTPDTGVAFTAITVGDEARARAELQRLVDHARAHRREGDARPLPLEEVMPRLSDHPRGPVLLVEPADNIGAGAPGDGTAVLRALIAHGIEGAAVIIDDAEAVAALGGRAPGHRARLRIGGRGSRLDPGPLALDVELVSTSDGRFELEDAHSHLAAMGGGRIDMGPCAVVRHGGVTILLTSRKTPPFDLGQLRSQGIVPERCRVIAVKAAVAHRRAYDPIAAASYTVDTPGPCTSNLARLPFRHVRRPIHPLDAV